MQFETNSLTDAVKEFIGIMKDSGLSYMYVKNDKFELELGQKNPPPAPPVMPAMPPMAMAAAPAVPTSAPQTQAPAAAPADTGKSIKSPIVGTFYSAPSPTKPPFVKVGDKVIYSKYSGNEVKLGEEEYIIVKQSDILAVVE